MARVYVDPDVVKPPFGDAMPGLPMEAIKPRLNDVRTQRLIPFLGAGASLPLSKEQKWPAPPVKPTEDQLAAISKDFSISTPNGKRFVEIALQFAQLVDQAPAAASARQGGCQSAPSSWELATELAAELKLEPYKKLGKSLERLLDEQPRRGDYVNIVKLVSRVMSLHTSIPQLLAVASFANRDELKGFLANTFAQVNDRMLLHDKIAEKAKEFVKRRNENEIEDKTDYIIITTNYDQLIEQALEKKEVPSCVMTVDRKTSKVLVDIPTTTKAFLGLSDDSQFEELKKQYRVDASRAVEGLSEFDLSNVADKFILPYKTHSLAMVYKLHGSLEIDRRLDLDNIVISDHDYVNFMQANGDDNHLIPNYVGSRMAGARLLFLGYSFSDWNVRGVYRQILNRRMKKESSKRDKDERDYVVTRTWEDTDKMLFSDWDISVLVTLLNNFAQQL